jgi:hypothetical protein
MNVGLFDHNSVADFTVARLIIYCVWYSAEYLASRTMKEQAFDYRETYVFDLCDIGWQYRSLH